MTFDKFFYIKIREKKLKILSSPKPIQKIRDNCFHFQYLENMNLKCLSAEIYVPISLEFIFFFLSPRNRALRSSRNRIYFVWSLRQVSETRRERSE